MWNAKLSLGEVERSHKNDLKSIGVLVVETKVELFRRNLNTDDGRSFERRVWERSRSSNLGGKLSAKRDTISNEIRQAIVFPTTSWLLEAVRGTTHWLLLSSKKLFTFSGNVEEKNGKTELPWSWESDGEEGSLRLEPSVVVILIMTADDKFRVDEQLLFCG